MGYVKGKSVPSLLGGCGLGAGFLAAGYLIQQAQRPEGTASSLKTGHDVALGCSCLTSGIMGMAWVKRGGMPKLPVALVTLGALSGAFHLKKRMAWAAVE